MVTYAVPVQTINADSVGLKVLVLFPSISSAPVQEIMNEPVPLFLNSVNQLSPRVAAAGSIAVPAPLLQTRVCALSVVANVEVDVIAAEGWL